METRKLDRLFLDDESKYLFQKFDTTYLVTTENIAGYMPKLKDKDVLTVCSCGDHFLNALFNGAKRIDLFDINEFTYAVLNLKIAAILSLNYEEYLTYFGIINRDKILDYNLYYKIRNNLSEEFIEVFDYLYKCCSYSGKYMIDSTRIFYLNNGDKDIMISNCNFLSEENYNYLKNILKSKEIYSRFIHSNLFSLCNKLCKKYDAIFLSNIPDYYDSTRIIQLVENLSQFLRKNGRLFFAYLYKNKNISNYRDYQKYVNEHDNCFTYEFPSFNRNEDEKDIKDKVFVLKK